MQGKQVYDKWCEPCHGPGIGLGGGGLPGTQQLGIKYRNSNIPDVLDLRTDLAPEYIELIVRQGVSFMPQFRKTEVSDADMKVLNTYLTRNNPGNQ
jgi:mono/diheme cytochrome c family protein